METTGQTFLINEDGRNEDRHNSFNFINVPNNGDNFPDNKRNYASFS